MSSKGFNNNNDSLNFSINHENKLVIKANSNPSFNKNFAISYISDDNQFLSNIAGILNTSNSVYDIDQPNALANLKTENITLIDTPITSSCLLD